MKAIILISFILALAIAGKPDANGCTGETNLHPIIDTPPTLVKETAFGQKYTIGNLSFIQTMIAESSIF